MFHEPDELGDFEYAGKRKQTRRERFLAKMDQVVPWSGLLALIEPYYPKAGGGRKLYPLETMLRIHLPNLWMARKKLMGMGELRL